MKQCCSAVYLDNVFNLSPCGTRIESDQSTPDRADASVLVPRTAGCFIIIFRYAQWGYLPSKTYADVSVHS